MVVVKWMKLVLLVVGIVGGFAFFEPFYDYGQLEVSPYRMVTGFTAEELGLENDPIRLREVNDTVMYEDVAVLRGFYRRTNERRVALVPCFFAAAVLWGLIGLGAIVAGRLGFMAALFTLAASLLAIGGYMREYRWQRDLLREGHAAILSTSATLLLVTGLVALAASIVALIWRDPGRPKKPTAPPAVDIPAARIVRR